MKLVGLMLIAGLAAYAQRGHSGGGMGHIGGSPSPWGGAGDMHENVGSPEQARTGDPAGRAVEQGRLSQQSPETVLERNTKLSSKLDGLLPSGTTSQQACSGFKNLGNCVSAIHVSHNLGIPFDELKARLTGSSPEKLGTAIHDLKPDVNPKEEVKKARKQAKGDMEAADHTTT